MVLSWQKIDYNRLYYRVISKGLVFNMEQSDQGNGSGNSYPNLGILYCYDRFANMNPRDSRALHPAQEIFDCTCILKAVK